MAIFDDITLVWNGVDHKIPASRVLGAIARIEDVLTLQELHKFQEERGTAPMARLSQAYGSLLRYAGAGVTDDEVYVGLFSGGDSAVVANSIRQLIFMMIPPTILKKEAQPGKLPGLPSEKSSSSEKRTKR